MAQELDYHTEHRMPAPGGIVDYKPHHKDKKPYKIEQRYVWISKHKKEDVLSGYYLAHPWYNEEWHNHWSRYATERDMKNAYRALSKKHDDTYWGRWKKEYRMRYPDGRVEQ